MVQPQLEKPPLVKKVILLGFALGHIYQNNVLSKTEFEH